MNGQSNLSEKAGLQLRNVVHVSTRYETFFYQKNQMITQSLKAVINFSNYFEFLKYENLLADKIEWKDSKWLWQYSISAFSTDLVTWYTDEKIFSDVLILIQYQIPKNDIKYKIIQVMINRSVVSTGLALSSVKQHFPEN